MEEDIEWVQLSGYENVQAGNDQPKFLNDNEINDIERNLNDPNHKFHFPLPPAASEEAAEVSRREVINFILTSLRAVKICPSAIPELLTLIINRHYKSLITPGTPVGITAAEAIGATTTQMTLNSVAPWEKLLIQDISGKGHEVEIGPWIDSLLEKNPEKIVHIPENRTQYLELAEPVKIVTCDNEGKVTWEDVTAVTKHVPVGDLVKITTKSGRE